MRSRLSYCIAVCMAISHASIDVNRASANGIRDQGKIFSTQGLVSLGTDNWTQSITTGIAGQLEGIQTQFSNFSLPPAIDLAFSVFGGGNPPTGPDLYSEQLTITGIDLQFEYTWDVRKGNLFFDVGDVFTFGLRVPQTGVDIAADYDDEGNGYSRGELNKNGIPLPLEMSDLAFVTYVIPDPIVGDFDQDGLLSTKDIDLLSMHVVEDIYDENYDLNQDQSVNEADREIWVHALKSIWFGDANLDGEFNSSDLITVLAAGTYEADIDAGWAEGDFDGSGRFNTGDLIFALADGGYEQGPRAAANAIPEPTSILTLIVGLIGVAIGGRHVGP